MAQAKQDMGSGSVKKLMLQLMIPAVVAQVVNLLYNIVDRIYIGHIEGIGAAALTGVGLFTPILMLLNAFAMLVGAGGAPRTAIALGQGDRQQAEKIISNSFTVLMLFAVVLTIGFYAGAPALLRLFGASDATLPYALSYSHIYILGSVFVLLVMGMNPFITTQGFAKTSMLTTVIGAVINIILDPILIFGFGLGVRGAAIATVLSQAVGAAWILRFLTGKKTILRLRKDYLRPEKQVILPVLALAGMVTVVQNTIRQPYALEVQVNGQTVGYVANEDVFNSAKEAVQERINDAGTDENTKWTVEPTYTISVAHSVLDENEMANAILKSSSDQISEGTALYLDGELTAVCSDGTALQSYLSSLLEPYENPEDPNVTVGFNKEVTLENGIYFNESFQQENDVESMLSGVQQQEKIYTVQTGDTLWSIAQKNDLTFRELCELNTNFKGAALTETSNIQAGDELIVTKQEATLEVRITKIETWQEEIPYTSETTKSKEYNVGTKKTTQAGENGIRSVTAQRVYDTNGTQLSQQILSTEVIKEPVTEKIVVGTKKVTTSTSYITGSGQFIWPVPGYRNCSRWYGGSHKGVDICAAAGTPIYASAGGTVTKAGYNKAGAGTGYGYSIIINHGNGYTTVYAHCLSLVVHAGQTVKQGQLIGYVGSTGRSSGNHCHFEIRRNGSYIAPQNVFNRRKYR